MSDTDTTPADRKEAIARLVSKGKMTHEHPGQYIPEDVDDDSRSAIPDYDVDVIREALPDVLQLDFDENEEEGCFCTLEDGKTGDAFRIILGADPPPTTADLIAIIQKHYADAIGLDAMEQTADAFAAFDEME